MLTYMTLCFVFICNNRTVPKFRISVVLSEGLLQAEAMEHFCYDYVHYVLIETTTFSNVKCKSRKRHMRPKFVSIICTTQIVTQFPQS